MKPESRLRIAALVTAALALTAVVTRHTAKRAEQRFPPSGKHIEIDGIAVHYLECGSGPPVVLLHGNGAEATDFVGCGLIAALAVRHRVIAFDRPGFGYSERPRDRLWTPAAQAQLLARACAKLEIRNPVVVGHSLGTQIALELALDTDLQPAGLVLLSGYYFPTARLDTLLLSGPGIPVLGDVMRYTVSPLISRLLLPRVVRTLFSPQEVPAAFAAAVPPGMMLRPWQLKAAGEDSMFMIPAAASLSHRYGELSLPVEIFAGAGDKVVRQAKQSPRLHEAIAHSALHWIPGEGHMLHYGMGNAITAAIDRISANA